MQHFSFVILTARDILLAMARKTPVPQSEVEIGKRLAIARGSLGLSRVGLAERVHVDSSVLTRVELGRTPLQYRIAKLLWREIPLLSPAWLAAGQGTMQLDHWLALPRPDEIAVPSGELFSVVYKCYEAQLQSLAAKSEELRYLPSSWIPAQRRLLERERQELRGRDLISDEFADWVRLMETRAAEEEERKVLTDTKHYEITDCVRTLAKLLDDVRRFTAAPGAKTRLAKHLDPPIPLATLSRYLSGKMEPGGKATLQLLNWVEAQKRKK